MISAMKHQNTLQILIVEDCPLALDALKLELNEFGKLHVATNSIKANQLISEKKFDVAFIDLNLDGEMIGFEIAKDLIDRGTYTIISSGHKDREFLKQGFEVIGVRDYITKPFFADNIKKAMERFLQIHHSAEFDLLIRSTLHTNSKVMDDAIQLIKTTYSGNSPIYLFGPTGTGKQLVAELIHKLKFKTPAGFHHINCSSIPENLIESHLFGHEKGAFTGANNRNIGFLEKANSGTLFLDEVASMSRNVQDKIITAIELKRFRRVGSNIEIESDFRLIAATSSNIFDEINKGNFRSDLFFRLNGSFITLPSLKERIDDLDEIIQGIRKKYFPERILYFNTQTAEILKKYDWPGNIRELKNMVFQWMERGKSFIDQTDLPSQIFESKASNKGGVSKILTPEQNDYIKKHGLKALEKFIRVEAILESYEETGSIRQTGSILRIHTDQVYFALGKKRKKHND